MKHFLVFLAASIALSISSVKADDIFKQDRGRWLRIAQQLKPKLHETLLQPKAVVKAVKDASAFQGWKYETVGKPSDTYSKSFRSVRSVTFDLGKHAVGYVSLHFKTLSSSCQDAPVRVKVFCGELPAELNTAMPERWTAGLSRAWMQDEILTVERMDTTVTLERRVACRYIKVELLAESPGFDFALDNVLFTAVSSAGEDLCSVSPECNDTIRKIREVSVNTLHECMQTVYEDGPKRDRRLWLGDLYLQSLANMYSFKNHGLTRRCLYLFATLSSEDGIIYANSFESPFLQPQRACYLLPYNLLYISTLLEYVKATGDTATAKDLWKVAYRQLQDALEYVDNNGMFNTSHRPSWLFFDWRDGLDVNVCMQGATIFALDQIIELAKALGIKAETGKWAKLSRTMKSYAASNMYDKAKGVFVSGKDKQVSVMSQVWMIKSGVVAGTKARRAINTVMNSPQSVKPGTPYATHYLMEAMIKCGMNKEAKDYMVYYWGGMIQKGADTFFEAYDPQNDFISPYQFSPLNSACHAWSCTPVYFINKYPEIFQTPNGKQPSSHTNAGKGKNR